ncbi:MAG: molybdopterin-dependent oxidoreductase [Mucilaginibacter sp.]
MKKFILALIVFIALSPTVYVAHAQTKVPAVKVTGEVTTPLDLKLADLGQYPQSAVTRKDKDGKEHTYSGVMLSAILQKAGVTLGKELRGKNLTKYIVVEASDGYRVVFALAELDKDFTDRAILLADLVDGAPLPPADGPFRIIIQDEKKPARCIKQVTAIKVVFAP